MKYMYVLYTYMYLYLTVVTMRLICYQYIAHMVSTSMNGVLTSCDVTTLVYEFGTADAEILSYNE